MSKKGISAYLKSLEACITFFNKGEAFCLKLHVHQTAHLNVTSRILSFLRNTSFGWWPVKLENILEKGFHFWLIKFSPLLSLWSAGINYWNTFVHVKTLCWSSLHSTRKKAGCNLSCYFLSRLRILKIRWSFVAGKSDASQALRANSYI